MFSFVKNLVVGVAHLMRGGRSCSWALYRELDNLRIKRTPLQKQDQFVSKSGLFFMGGPLAHWFCTWKTPKKENPPGGGISFDESCRTHEHLCAHLMRVGMTIDLTGRRGYQQSLANGNTAVNIERVASDIGARRVEGKEATHAGDF